MTRAVTIRPVAYADGPALIRAHVESRALHTPWAEPFTDMAGFKSWFATTLSDRKVSMVAEYEGRIAGLINLNEIVRGGFLSAYLGYHGMAGVTGRGVMTEAVRLTVAHAFGPLGLHRVEANIQPGNARSLALVQRLGFRCEGFSPRYLRIAGAWRDHERWAKLADDVA
ncbi:GNAT family N-acetyltransferase [Limobrevibacterium gyesilva]|uniref:GNAT family N-acetyltransferase n=1 Tax=Limobrevibacterium gyesilva TaxID=2991712 RepID=A0AA42CDM9_9PROT|nr:GNAT family protein [Limobrevibacterium gyesilva]MCW3474109.1 GNAT family N-acetyltransferase [Limobrevibacterium gyesilva]